MSQWSFSIMVFVVMLSSHKSLNTLFIISDPGHHRNTYCPFLTSSALVACVSNIRVCGLSWEEAGWGGVGIRGWGCTETLSVKNRLVEFAIIYSPRGNIVRWQLVKSAQLSIDHAFLLPWLPLVGMTSRTLLLSALHLFRFKYNKSRSKVGNSG